MEWVVAKEPKKKTSKKPSAGFKNPKKTRFSKLPPIQQNSVSSLLCTLKSRTIELYVHYVLRVNDKMGANGIFVKVWVCFFVFFARSFPSSSFLTTIT